MNAQIYLDYAAASPLDKDVLEAMLPYMSDKFFNPSAQYTAAQEVRKTIETARSKVAGILGAKSSEIIFTGGGTEANNLAIHGVMAAHPDGKLLVSAIEHDSVLAPAQRYKCEVIPVAPDGRVDAAGLTDMIDEETVLVSVMHASNEIGTIQPIREIAQVVQAIRRQRLRSGNKKPLLLHADACQTANYLDLHADRLGVDLMTLNGGKIYGPKGSGALFIKSGSPLQALQQGGGQERNLRSGTENVSGILGFAFALDKAQALRREESARLQALQRDFIEKLQQVLPDAELTGSLKYRLPNNVHITIPGTDNERLLYGLDEAGIMAAAGSACSASDDEPSHVLKALGMSDELCRSSLRFSMGRATTAAHIEKTVNALAKLV